MPAKSAQKPAVKNDVPKYHEAKELRRSYEHLGRVEILRRLLQPARSKDIRSLVDLAERELGEGHRRDAADLLRAVEHFAFAALADTEPNSNGISQEIVDVVTEEVEHFTRRAKEHWDEHPSPVAALFHNALEASAKALDAGSYRQALELARGAEALAHLRKRDSDEPGSGKPRLKLPRP